MQSLFVLTQNANGILKPIAKLLGYLLNGIYIFFDDVLNIQNISITIIVFTIVIYICLLPLTYKQQKFSKMSQIMNPELQAIQKKYKGKRDQASMSAMSTEQQAVYKKYGVSPSGSCITMAIQLLILFPLYRVIYNVPAYIPRIREQFSDVIDRIMNTGGYARTMSDFLAAAKEGNARVFSAVSFDVDDVATHSDSIIDILYRCSAENWNTLKVLFSDFADKIGHLQTVVDQFNNFLGVSITYSPKNLIGTGFKEGEILTVLIAILIPVFSLGTQFLNLRLAPQASMGGDNPAGNQMKMMTYLMPFYSFFIVFFLPVGVGIYWITGAVIRIIQQLVINRHFDKMDLEAVFKENEAKAAAKKKEKIEKKGVTGRQIADTAAINTRRIGTAKEGSMAAKASVGTGSGDGRTSAGKKYKEGSLAAKANLVSSYNERNTRKKPDAKAGTKSGADKSDAAGKNAGKAK